MYKRILLAVDGSDHSIRAAQEAVKIANLGNKSHIDVVYVADFESIKRDVLYAQGEPNLDYTTKQRIQPVEDLLKLNGIPYSVQLLHGEPGPAIVEYANKEQFDLVILGSRGLNKLQEMVLGSVSHKVVKRVNGPVLIVK